MDLLVALKLVLNRFLEPLVAATRDPVYRHDLLVLLGLDGLALVDTVQQELGKSFTNATSAIETLATFDTADASPRKLLEFLQSAEQTMVAVRLIADATAPLAPHHDATALLDELFSLLTLKYLVSYTPKVYELALLLTIIRARLEDESQAPLLPYVELGRIPKLLTDPGRELRDTYLGTSGLASLKTADEAREAADQLFPRLAALLQRLGVNADYVRALHYDLPAQEGPMDRALIMQLPWKETGLGAALTLVSEAESGPGFLICPIGNQKLDATIGDWIIQCEIRGELPGLLIRATDVLVPDNQGMLGAELTIDKKTDTAGFVFQTSASGTRLAIADVRFASAVSLSGNGDRLFELLAELRETQITISTDDGDTFLQRMLPFPELSVPADVAIGWSNSRGLHFRGSAGLELTMPLHRTLFDIITINSFTVSFRSQEDMTWLSVAISGSFTLGPVAATLEQIGLEMELDFSTANGNLGPAQLSPPRFKPPKGIGLVVEAGPITGGGYLFLNPGQEGYAGILHLLVKDKIALTVIGLLTTRLPDGRQGFSLLLIITSEFPPIQLGYGFVLTGVGGLIGIHRTMVVDALRAGVQGGGLNAILFPKNPVENAQRIISDLKSFFPPAEGRFTFGPMAQIGWGGAYPLLTIELGILIEVPAPIRVALLGRITLALPKREQPEDLIIIFIQMDILGILDFEKSDLSIDATLFDSRIAHFPITGDMAQRFNWGSSPTFALSAGGFHPGYTPPPAFPNLRRLAISLAQGDNPRIRAESYLAVTTAAAMFGAHLEMYAERRFGRFGTFSIQGHLGFDALVRFKPFHFIVDMGAAATLRRNGKVLFAVTLSLTLSGPQPFDARGFARFEFLGKHEIPVAITIGVPPEADEPLPLARPIDDLVAEVGKSINWNAQLPPSGQVIVTLREVERQENAVLAHPLGRLTFRQQVVPLRTEISRYGGAQIVGPTFFDLDVHIGGQKVNFSTGLVRDNFAPGMYSELSDDARLSEPAFVALPSGYEAIGLDVDEAEYGGQGQSRVFSYDETVIDSIEERRKTRMEIPYVMSVGILDAAAFLSAAAVSTLCETGASSFAGPTTQRVMLSEPLYVIASVDTLTRLDGAVSHYEAKLRRQQEAGTAHQWQVVGRYESR